MKAKEMFEELGYDQWITPAMLCYRKKTNKDYIIGFLFESKNELPYLIVGSTVDEEEQVMGLMSVKEHQAIQQQMKELGWLKEKDNE